MTTETVKVDPRKLTPGTRVSHASSGDLCTLDRRKDDDSGWWIREGGGLVDAVWDDGEWTVVSLGTRHTLDLATVSRVWAGDDAGKANEMLVEDWVLLAAGIDANGFPLFVLGWSP